MLALDAIVISFAQGVVAGTKNNIRTMDPTGYGPMNNTGRGAESINFRWANGKLTFYSSWEHIWTFEFGRGPGKMPPVSSIEPWVHQRGIGMPEEREGIAFGIARKIAEHGTLLNQKYRATGKGSGILTKYLNEQYIIESLGPDLQTKLIEEITRTIVQAA